MRSYVITVSLCTGCYRHIQISASKTLFSLHAAIIKAFGREDNRAHIFFMDNQLWGLQNAYFSYKSEQAERLSKDYKLEQFPLKKGDKFCYLFDEWVFRCKILRELEMETENPKIIRTVGEIPERFQGVMWDEEDDFPELYSEATILTLYERLPLSHRIILCIEEYFQAAASLYGILSVGELFDLYNSQNKPVSQEDFLAVAEVIRHKPHEDYEVLGEEAFYSDVPKSAPMERKVVAQYLLVEENADAYVSLIQQQEGKPLKILPKGEFLRYADPFYCRETKEFKAMRKYLSRKEKSLRMTADVMCEAIQSLIEIDCPLDELQNCMKSEGWYFTSQADILEFMNLYQAMNNHTRKHSNRGHTPAELFDESEPRRTLTVRSAQLEQLSLFDEPPVKPTLTIVGKPSRNQPCSCGSGQKYKNCCGKNS